MSDNDNYLSWRIPVPDESRGIRRGALRLATASVVFLCLVWVFFEDNIRTIALIVLVPCVLIVLAFLLRRRVRPSLDDNIRLNRSGLEWQNEHGGTGRISRERMKAYRLFMDPESMLGLPALTLILSNDRESQPIPIVGRATPSEVRAVLGREFNLQEQVLSHDEARVQLRRALEGVLSWQGNDAAAEYLRFAMMNPIHFEGETWKVFRFCETNRQGVVEWSPQSCQFEFNDGDDPIKFDQFNDLVEYVRDHVVPDDVHERNQRLVEIDEELNIRAREAIRRDARNAGFYSECLPASRRWLFRGKISALTKIVDALRQAAKLDPPEDGERPLRIEVTGDAMPVNIQVEDFAWFGDGVIAGSPEKLTALANTIEERLRDLNEDQTMTIEPPNDAAERWLLEFAIASDDYDPGDFS